MSILETMIGWLAPPVCLGCGQEESALCEGCALSEILPLGERCYQCGALSSRSRTCKSHRKDSPRYAWIVTDYDGLAQELIKKYKFGHLRAASWPIANLMVEAMIACNGRSASEAADYMVVPVPTDAARVRERSFGHAELLASQVAAQLKLPCRKILSRRGHVRQVGTRREQRLRQQVGNYYVPRPAAVAGHNILLIDDVVTTGATLRAATKALRAAGAKHIDALIFAKAL